MHRRDSRCLQHSRPFFFSLATYETLFPLHVDFKQTVSLALVQTRRQKKALTAKNSHLTGERGRQIKEVRTRERSEGGRQTGSSRGLLIRESLVTESFEMTADLRESIIRLRYATALLPPVPLRGGVSAFQEAAVGEPQTGTGWGKLNHKYR